MSAYEGIIVLGVPRSGTTLLRRLLNAHPRIACPPETNLLGAASRFLEEAPFAGGMSVGVVPGLAFSGFDEAQVLERLRELVFGFMREIAVRASKPRWAEKTAVDIFHLDPIWRLCGERCRYIALVRHPLDVVCSIRELSDKMGAYLPELHHYVARHAMPMEAFAHAWRDANTRLLEFTEHHPQQCLRLRYEDLVLDPATVLDRVFNFLQEPCDAAAVVAEAMGKTSAAGLGDWKTFQQHEISRESIGRHAVLDAETTKRLAAIVNPVMPALGYEPVTAAGAASAEEARRRYQLGLMVAGLRPPKGSPQGK